MLITTELIAECLPYLSDKEPKFGYLHVRGDKLIATDGHTAIIKNLQETIKDVSFIPSENVSVEITDDGILGIDVTDFMPVDVKTDDDVTAWQVQKILDVTGHKGECGIVREEYYERMINTLGKHFKVFTTSPTDLHMFTNGDGETTVIIAPVQKHISLKGL